jgi:hypothetical protein
MFDFVLFRFRCAKTVNACHLRLWFLASLSCWFSVGLNLILPSPVVLPSSAVVKEPSISAELLALIGWIHEVCLCFLNCRFF